MDFKNFLKWIVPKNIFTNEPTESRIDRARTRDKLIRSNMPRFTERDGKGIYDYLAMSGQLTAQTFRLWMDFITRKRNHH